MPHRIARSSITNPSTKQPVARNSRKRKDRNLNAFSIASKTNPELTRIRQHRLGESELDAEEPTHKRQRLHDEQPEAEDDVYSSNAQKLQQKNVKKHEFDEIDVQSGSDSEGKQWHVGFEPGRDEEEELDSDEAFGEGDEERFEDFAFRGSKSHNVKKRRIERLGQPGYRELTLEEDKNVADRESGLESDDSLGSDAVDLATMLDHEMSDEEIVQLGGGSHASPPNADDEFGGWSDEKDSGSSGAIGRESDSSDHDEDSMSSFSDEDTKGSGRQRLGQLMEVVASLSRGDNSESDDESDDVALKPGALTAALKTMSSNDQSSVGSGRKTLKNADRSGEGPLKAPLPKRQQDGVNRQVAYQKAKETLDRWQDTVKHNRRAEHLMFPLRAPDAQEAQGSTRMLPLSTHQPRNELENAIEGILQQSGLGRGSADGDVTQDCEHDDLPENNPSLKAVQERRAEMRKMRDLLFREEQRSKRIKKIKSKAYRRVHRRERERNAEKERVLMTAAGIEPSEDEQERLDRWRAEERMGARHRESRWAKSVKQTGRAAWDEDTRSGVQAMARRDEELRQRLQGKPVNSENDDGLPGSDASSEEEDDADLEERLDKLDRTPAEAQQSRLGSLKFMQRADDRRKQQNDEAIEDIRRDFAEERGEIGSEEDVNPGRQIFGATKASNKSIKVDKPRNELDEGKLSDAEDHHRDSAYLSTNFDAGTQGTLVSPMGATKAELAPTQGPVLLPRARPSNPKSAYRPNAQVAMSPSPGPAPEASSPGKRSPLIHAGIAPPLLLQKSKSKMSASHVNHQSPDRNEDDASDHDDGTAIALNPTNEELVRAAFGIDDSAEAEFATEKRAAADSEDEKVVDNSLPGWGSWAGAGISRKQKAFAKQKAKQLQTKEAGVKGADRKDAKLQNVIVSGKRVRKNAKYLAPTLPHPYESQQQYERSLRLPIGPEWTTKESFQGATKPRVLLKQGIIQPMETPLV